MITLVDPTMVMLIIEPGRNVGIMNDTSSLVFMPIVRIGAHVLCHVPRYNVQRAGFCR